MMDLSFIKSLIKAVDQSSIDSVDIERGGTRVRISKTPTSASGAPTVVHAATPAPMPAAAPPQAPAAASGGDTGAGEPDSAASTRPRRRMLPRT